mgnify:CR=1 FL=1
MTTDDRLVKGKAKDLYIKGLRLAIGLVSFIGAVFAIYFLLIQGGVLLVIGVLVEVISRLGPPEDQDAFGSILFLPAMMVVSGLCLGSGLVDLACRGLAGKPLTGKRSVLRLFLIALTLIFVTVIAVVVRMTA